MTAGHCSCALPAENYGRAVHWKSPWAFRKKNSLGPLFGGPTIRPTPLHAARPKLRGDEQHAGRDLRGIPKNGLGQRYWHVHSQTEIEGRRAALWQGGPGLPQKWPWTASPRDRDTGPRVLPNRN